MDPQTLAQLQERADLGSIEALRHLIAFFLSHPPGGGSLQHAYKYCVMAAFLGDEPSHRQAADLFAHLPPAVEEAVIDEVGEWIELKFDEVPPDDVDQWSPEMLRLRFPPSEVH